MEGEWGLRIQVARMAAGRQRRLLPDGTTRSELEGCFEKYQGLLVNLEVPCKLPISFLKYSVATINRDLNERIIYLYVNNRMAIIAIQNRGVFCKYWRSASEALTRLRRHRRPPQPPRRHCVPPRPPRRAVIHPLTRRQPQSKFTRLAAAI